MQADLARAVAIGVPALRQRLKDLKESGMPLHDERDGSFVYWSVPKTWFPGGIAIGSQDAEVLLRLLTRMPKSRERDRVIALVLTCLPGREPPVVPRAVSGQEDDYMSAIEDAATRARPIRFRYISASHGGHATREASVHRIAPGPPARFLATCHRDGKLKWFRVDGVSQVSVATGEFRAAAMADIEEHVQSSLDGFHDASAPKETHAFSVRLPEALWVERNLLEGMRVEHQGKSGMRVVATTTALHRLGRFVVGLGDAATAETPALRAEVERLALGALARCRDAAP